MLPCLGCHHLLGGTACSHTRAAATLWSSLVDEEDQVLHPEVKLGEDLPGGQVEVAGAEVFRWDEA